MSQSAAPATQTDMTTCLDTFEKERFCSFSHRHGEATGKPETRDETRGSIKTSISCKTSSNFDTSKSMFSCKIYKFSLEHENLQPQNRCFVRGFRQFSSHITYLTKRHACHEICTSSPLDAALPMRFAQDTQHDTSKALRLPRQMTMDTSKVLRLPQRLQRVF